MDAPAIAALTTITLVTIFAATAFALWLFVTRKTRRAAILDVTYWKDEAQRYAQNADFWRLKTGRFTGAAIH